MWRSRWETSISFIKEPVPKRDDAIITFLLAAVAFDDTESVRIGACFFDHSFLFPGTVTIIVADIPGCVFVAILLYATITEEEPGS